MILPENSIDFAIVLVSIALLIAAGLSMVVRARREQKRAEIEEKHREMVRKIREEKMRRAAEEKGEQKR